MTILLLLFAMIFNIGAQYFLKQSVVGIRFDGFNISLISKFLANYNVWIGVIMYGASFVFYILALSRGELSRISPVSQALTTVGVVLLSVLFFNEVITITKFIGLILLIIGTIIIFI